MIYCVFGPTACGKTEYAFRLANELGGVVINYDSAQVYSGLPILTDQPPVFFQKFVPHYCYAHVLPTEEYSLSCWMNDVFCLIRTKISQGISVVLVGGTAMYLRSLIWGVTPFPPICPLFQERVRAYVYNNPRHAWLTLQECDDQYTLTAFPNDIVRNARAVEVLKYTGVPFSRWKGYRRIFFPLSKYRVILISPKRKIMHERIYRRISSITNEKLLREYEDFCSAYPSFTQRISSIIGFKELRELYKRFSLRQDILDYFSLPLFCRTKQYAKKQMTWVRWFSKRSDISVIMKESV